MRLTLYQEKKCEKQLPRNPDKLYLLLFTYFTNTSSIVEHNQIIFISNIKEIFLLSFFISKEQLFHPRSITVYTQLKNQIKFIYCLSIEKRRFFTEGICTYKNNKNRKPQL